MNKPRTLLLVSLFAAALLIAAGAGRPLGAAPAPVSGSPPARPDRLLVSFQANSSLSRRLGSIGRLGLRADSRFVSPYFARIEIPAGIRALGVSVADIAAELRQDPAVRFAEPDYLLQGDSLPNDPRFPEQWPLRNIGQTGGVPGADIEAAGAWDTVTGNDTSIIAVIDSGIDYRHAELSPNILRNGTGQIIGFDFLNEDPDPIDDNGHGTHVSGILGAAGNNALGITGVCQRARIMPLKFMDRTLNGSVADAVQCIDFAIANGARIINASFGGRGFSLPLLEAVRRAEAAGVLIVAACGNDGISLDQFPVYPAGFTTTCANVVSVAATDAEDRLAPFSNFGSGSVDLAAPGAGILSTIPNDSFLVADGTSMAAPHVTGVAALLLARNPALSAAELKSRLLNSAERLASLSGRVRTAGRLCAGNALQANSGTPASLESVALSPGTLVGGESTTGTLTLTSAAPLGGVAVALESADPAKATLPELVQIPEGATQALFRVDTTPVASPAQVQITATSSGVTRTASVLVAVASLIRVSLDPLSVPGGKTSMGAVQLNGMAPAGGATVALSSSSRELARVPATVVIPAGATGATFSVKTQPVKRPTEVTLRGTYRSVMEATTLTLLPPLLKSVTVKPARVTGGETATGTLNLRFAAPTGGLRVALSSGDSTTATVGETVTVPAGQRAVTFPVGTSRVNRTTTVIITATESGNSAQGKLTVKTSR